MLIEIKISCELVDCSDSEKQQCKISANTEWILDMSI